MKQDANLPFAGGNPTCRPSLGILEHGPVSHSGARKSLLVFFDLGGIITAGNVSVHLERALKLTPKHSPENPLKMFNSWPRSRRA